MGTGAATPDGTGFTIELPSKAPIPSPTIYQGKIYLSGGFHSKEFYCMRADTGATGTGFRFAHAANAVIQQGLTISMLMKTVLSGKVEPKKLITHRFALTETLKAYETFGNAMRERALKVIIRND